MMPVYGTVWVKTFFAGTAGTPFAGMRRMVRVAALPATLFLLVACGRTGDAGRNTAAQSGNFAGRLPPAILTDDRDRADYIVGRYWDAFDFSDTACMHQLGTAQAFVDYLRLVALADTVAARASLTGLLDRSRAGTGRVYEYFRNLLEESLYDASSPFRNDECYIPVARYVMNDTSVDEAGRKRAGLALTMLLKNRRGQPAENVLYRTVEGKSGHLYGLRREYTLVLFHNPGCHACGETLAALRESATLGQLLSAQRLDVLAIYPDSDLTAWREHAGEIPRRWINARDGGGIYDRYDLRAIPSLYLLDRDKRVLLKDAAPQQILEELDTKSEKSKIERVALSAVIGADDGERN